MRQWTAATPAATKTIVSSSANPDIEWAVSTGATGTVIIGILVYGEPATIGRLVSIAVIVAGVIALRVVSSNT